MKVSFKKVVIVTVVMVAALAASFWLVDYFGPAVNKNIADSQLGEIAKSLVSTGFLVFFLLPVWGAIFVVRPFSRQSYL